MYKTLFIFIQYLYYISQTNLLLLLLLLLFVSYYLYTFILLYNLFFSRIKYNVLYSPLSFVFFSIYHKLIIIIIIICFILFM
jgi:hypothetical protein